MDCDTVLQLQRAQDEQDTKQFLYTAVMSSLQLHDALTALTNHQLRKRGVPTAT